ncbi:hypothetical protein GOBAR_AA24546 [Gossypium barbadense]|uniref:Reverse transcriptase zinc-binding domain-containing protein n=1 Tax=Gossypium barbadense TaxID=3634 RepID=A0A2P5WYE3_GOSBA|nr:hypothetical protein GOBAR_AA24546 [Gossypium barbadense]
MVSMDGDWNWQYLRCFLDDIILSYIAGIPVPNCLVGLNSMISQWPSSGSLLVKSAYNFLSKDALNPSEDSWKLVWSFVGPQHLKALSAQLEDRMIVPKDKLGVADGSLLQ